MGILAIALVGFFKAFWNGILEVVLAEAGKFAYNASNAQIGQGHYLKFILEIG